MVLNFALFIKKCAWFIWAIMVVKSFYWANILTKYRIRPLGVRTLEKGALLHFPAINLSVRRHSPTHILDTLQIAERLFGIAGAVFYFDENDKLIAQIADIKYYVHTSQTMQILNEVYIEGIYDIGGATQVVVVDIGMNAGIASLFIAKNMKVPIFAFEPFRETYQAALSNFALNPEVADLIRPYNFGIGAADASIEALYCPEASGDCGVIPIPEGYCQGRATKTEIIKLKPISEIIDLIRNDFPGKKLVLKIDCEGSEYEILQSLYESDSLKYVVIIMLEWHRRSILHDPSGIVDILINSGFNVLKRGSLEAPVGMLYAFHAVN